MVCSESRLPLFPIMPRGSATAERGAAIERFGLRFVCSSAAC
jgi:hypothetical protein